MKHILKESPSPSASRYKVALFNSSDPRGDKIGGIQTYTRDYIHYHPADMDLLIIGADESGASPIGVVSEIEFRGRTVKFLPLYRLKTTLADYSKGVTGSDTFFFAKHLVRNFFKIRKLLRDGNYTAEIRRVEYAPVLKAMGVPFIQMVHVWGSKGQPMSSALGKHWLIRDVTEALAALFSVKFYSVNQDMTEMYKKKFGMFSRKFDTLTTWANTDLFPIAPYRFDDHTINIVYAGRLDKFKRPDIMFRVVARLHEITGKARFHYIGDGDLDAVEEFSLIRGVTTKHGVRTSAEIGVLLESMHIGILTSEFEGMPRVVLETLSTGRPVVAMHLPQLEKVIIDSESGFLIARHGSHVEEHARRLLETYNLMLSGLIKPEVVAGKVAAFSPRALLGKIWSDHRRLHGLPVS